MTTYIALFSLTDAGVKAAKDSPRRLDAAKKLLTDIGGRDEAVLHGDGRLRLRRNLRGAGRRSDGPLRFAARGSWLRAHQDLEGIPGDRLPRNHSLVGLNLKVDRSRVFDRSLSLRPLPRSGASRPTFARFVCRGRDRRLPKHRMGLIVAGACLAHRRSAKAKGLAVASHRAAATP
jgi:hypothetical protein